MVVFLDLDEDTAPDDPHANPAGGLFAGHLPTRLPFTKHSISNDSGGSSDVERPDPNLNVTTRALGCYPIINQITSSLDLNTLHALSRTCRQIRSTLLQYRASLLLATLHCSNEVTPTTHPFPPSSTSSINNPQWHFLSATSTPPLHLGKKPPPCARDLVSPCWRCRTVICRNCTIKSSQAPRLPSRHRRLCSTCAAAPLNVLLGGSRRGVRKEDDNDDGYCGCSNRSHLCAPCGAKLVNADTTYRRIWTWRTRYTTYLGGLGTGIGEGNEGVKCARGRECLEAKDVEVEFECPSSSGSDGSEGGGGGGGASGGEPVGRVGTPGTPDLEDKAGYWRQEVEGLGGVVKKKFRKRERVGRTVREWEDEREGKGEILGREKRGECRSWCGWCGKVVKGVKGREGEWGKGDVESRVVRIELRGVRAS